MSKIRGKDTSIELTLAKVLWKSGLRYRKQYKKIRGTPDFVLISQKVAIFCDSAFWHGYKNMKTSRHKFRSNKKFWTNKIKKNIVRDKEINKELKKTGWKVVRIWDFDIKKNPEKCLSKVIRVLK